MFRIGDQRVGIVTDGAVTGYDEGNAPIYGDPTVVWVDGCLFELQSSAQMTATMLEQQSDTTTTSEVAICCMPVATADGRVAVVDDDGEPLGTIAFTDISSQKRLRDHATGRDYEMRGDAVHEIGKLPHIFALCERQTG